MAVITDIGLDVARIPAKPIGRGYWFGIGSRLSRPGRDRGCSRDSHHRAAAIFAP